MFLPVLLVADFGLLGWIAFAVPNVVGAAAVGALRKPARDVLARERKQAFAAWALVFSFATICFHIAFLGWMTPMVFKPFAPSWAQVALGALCAIVAGLAGLALSRARDAGMIAGSIVVYAFSLLFFALAYFASAGHIVQHVAATGTEPTWALLVVAPALAFGFLLCPQFDLTLLRARDTMEDRRRRSVFIIGFGVLFLLMIGMSLLYATGWSAGWINFWIIAHFAGQSVFTIGAHLRETRQRLGPSMHRRWLFAALALGVAMGALARTLHFETTAYQGFLLLYGLVFPVALWRFLFLRRSATNGLAGAFWITLAIAIGPYAWGYLTKSWWLVAAGLGLAILTPVALSQVRHFARKHPAAANR